MPQKIKSLFNVLDLGLLTVESEPQSIQPLLGNPEILFGIFGAQNHKVICVSDEMRIVASIPQMIPDPQLVEGI
jgi:hypothetical protein